MTHFESSADGQAHRYRVEMFGGFTLREAGPGGRVITRFRTQKTAALLAFLAFHRDRRHAREVLMDRFWPEGSGRMSLAVALSSLRSQLEPPGVPSHSVLIADRSQVGLNPDAVTTDVAQFEDLLDSAMARGEVAAAGTGAVTSIAAAIELYRPQLLPGQYESWIVPQQERLADRYRAAARHLAQIHEAAGRIEEAVRLTRQALHSAPAESAELCAELLRLLVAAGDPEAAVREYAQMQERLRQLAGPDGEDDLTLPEEVTRIVAPFLRGSAGAAGAPRRGESLGTPTAPPTDPVAPPEPVGAPQAPLGGAAGAGGPAPVAPAPASSAEASRPEGPDAVPLPTPLTRFFGRDAELPRLRSLLRVPGTRLLTITGPGGIGKTRLALALAAAARRGDPPPPDEQPPAADPLFPGSDQDAEAAVGPASVYWASLAHLAEPALTAATLAEAVGADTRGAASRSAEALLDAAAAVLNRFPHPVLVVDGAEHLVDETATALEHLLQHVPSLTCVATSRQRLALPGEREFALGALPTPPLPAEPGTAAAATEEPDPADLLHWYPSVALFVDRAQAARADFQINRRNAGAVAELVARLEGIPLAIELAAARAQVLSPAQMLGQLFPADPETGPGARFEMLTIKGRGRLTLERHRSLRATLAWSYDLLAPELRHLFARLALFRGSFDAEALDGILQEPVGGGERIDTLDALAELCDASLVRPVEEAGAGADSEPLVRFSMLETLRAFAEERLQAEVPPALVRDLHESHARFYLARAEELVDQGRRSPAREAGLLDRLDRDRDNLRAALRWAAGEAERCGEAAADEAERILLRLVAAMIRFWRMRGRMTEGRRWADAAIARCRCESDGAVNDHDRGTDVAGRATLEAAVLNGAGTLAMTQGDYEAAAPPLRRTLALRERIGDRPGVAAALNNLAIIAKESGDLETAQVYCERSLPVYRELGDDRLVGNVLSTLATLAIRRNDVLTAQRLCSESLDIADRLGDVSSKGTRLGNMGEVYYHMGDRANALRYYRESLRAATNIKDVMLTAHVLINLARLDADRGERRRAERLLLAAVNELAARQFRFQPAWRETFRGFGGDLWPGGERDEVPAASLLAALSGGAGNAEGAADPFAPSPRVPAVAPVPLSLQEAAAYALHPVDGEPASPYSA